MTRNKTLSFLTAAACSALLAARIGQPLRLELNLLALSMWLWGGMLYIWMMALIFCGAASSPRNGTSAIGSWVRPTPDTSTRNCAHAADKGADANAATRPVIFAPMDSVVSPAAWMMPMHS